MFPDNIWWNQVNSSSKLIDQLLESLKYEKNVLLTTNNLIPWKETLYNLVERRVGEVSSSKTIKFIKADSNVSPGKQLLFSCCSDKERLEYWPGMKYSEYIASLENSMFNKLFVWVKGIENANNVSDWRNFVKEYNEYMKVKKHQKALLILESYSSGSKINSDCFSNIDISSDEYDKYILCINIASQLKCSYYFKQYIADLSVGLGGSNVEICADFAMKGIELSKDPLRVCEMIYGNGDRISSDEIKSRVLISQMKIIFPLLEQERQKLINKYRNMLFDILPVKNNFNEIISNPNDLELSSLVNILNSSKVNVSSEDRQNITYYRKIRNKIAHNDIIDYANLLLLLGSEKI